MQPFKHKPCILITRPEPQASITAAQWLQKGYDCIISSVIEQRPVAEISTMLDGCNYDALIATSGYTLKLLAQHGFNPAMKLYLSGEILAKQAHDLGFAQVHYANSSARTLLAYMQLKADKTMSYAYLHSNHQAVNMVQELQGLGFRVKGLEIYHTQPAQHLTPQAIAALQAGEVEAVLLYSAMSAQSFLHLAKIAGLENNLKNITAICLSGNIASILPSGMFREVIIENIVIS